ncbi:MAG TPA: HEAT repeat domain-containing protein, partial [Candidatus Acidoferrum sp.]|nr:HEAT repeat domain-containing protein [Candidatus Acidoferrum sp.]
AIVVLTLMTIVFALLAIHLRFQHNRRDRGWQALRTRWDADILDVLSGDRGIDEFRRQVLPAQELDFIRFLAPYAYRLRGSDLDILAQLARHYLAHVEPMLAHRSPGVRIWAVNVLGLFGMPEKETVIASMLSDESPAVAMFAAGTLLSHQRTEFIDRIFDEFHRFHKWNTNALANLLVRAGPKAISSLERVYLDEKRPARTRVIAAEALGRCNAYSALNAALLVLGNENDVDILVATLHLLAHISQGRHIDAIRRICNSPNDVLRITAVRTLRTLGAHADLPAFRKAFTDVNPWVARHAALALRELGDNATLQTAADDEANPRCMMARQILAGSA